MVYAIVRDLVRGGGGVLPYAYWVYVPRERPPFSALNFRSGAYHFHNFFNIPLRSITILKFLPFRRPAELRELAQEPSTFHFAAALRGAYLAAGQSASQTRPTVRSGDPHLHAQLPRARSGLGSTAFSRSRSPRSLRSPAFLTLELDPEPPIFHFAAAHVYQNLG